MTSFKKRGIRVTFKLSSGAFNENNDDTVELEGLALRATLEMYSQGMSHCNMSVIGLSSDLLERLVTLKATPKGNAWQKNTLTLTLNEEGNRESILFTGDIYMSLPNYNVAPDVPLTIHATSLYGALMTVPPPMEFKGAAQAEFIMAHLAKLAGFSFVNNKVSTTLRDVSLNGDLGSMMRHVAKMADIALYIEADTVIISPVGVPREEIERIKISTPTGMIGYPQAIDAVGCAVSCLFDTKYKMLGRVDVDVPEIPVVNGEMFISSITHRVDTEIPRGQWFTDMKLLRWGIA